MNHKDKYIKYKSKYINLKYGVNLIGGALEFNNDYQEIIYEISKYLKPHMSNKLYMDLENARIQLYQNFLHN
jgi:hypothetical protein